MSHTGVGWRGHHRPPSWLAQGGRKLSPCPDQLSPTPLVMRITILVVSPLFFRLVWVTNSTPVFPHLFGEERHAKKPSNTILNSRVPKHGSFCVQRNIPPMETNAVDSDLLQFLHSSVLWKVMTSARENEFGEDSC